MFACFGVSLFILSVFLYACFSNPSAFDWKNFWSACVVFKVTSLGSNK